MPTLSEIYQMVCRCPTSESFHITADIGEIKALEKTLRGVGYIDPGPTPGLDVSIPWYESLFSHIPDFLSFFNREPKGNGFEPLPQTVDYTPAIIFGATAVAFTVIIFMIAKKR